MGFFGCIPRFVKDHAGWILTGLGSAGLVGTAVLTAKEAPVAHEKLKKAEWEAYESTCTDDYTYKELTWWEKIKIATPVYIPAILTGVGSLGCFWGSQIFNAKVQAGLVTAYGALAMQFDQYRGAIRDEYGEEADKKALAAANIEIQKLREANAELLAENGPFLYGIATLPGVVFEAKPIDIQEVFMQWNRNLTLRGENDLEELYEFLDIPEMCYDGAEARKYGCNQHENEITWGIGYVDFELFEVETKNGPIRIIHTPGVMPYLINGNYGEYSSGEPKNQCPTYNMPLAIERARQIGENDIITTAHPAAHYPVYCIG